MKQRTQDADFFFGLLIALPVGGVLWFAIIATARWIARAI